MESREWRVANEEWEEENLKNGHWHGCFKTPAVLIPYKQPAFYHVFHKQKAKSR